MSEAQKGPRDNACVGLWRTAVEEYKDANEKEGGRLELN